MLTRRPHRLQTLLEDGEFVVCRSGHAIDTPVPARSALVVMPRSEHPRSRVVRTLEHESGRARDLAASGWLSQRSTLKLDGLHERTRDCRRRIASGSNVSCDSVRVFVTPNGCGMTQLGAQSPTVFVIDDDDDVRASIAGLLKTAGLRAETFTSAQEFLSRERSDGPGCLVIDFTLPNMTGFEARRQLSDAGLRIPTIFISGYDDQPTIAHAMRSGAVAFLTKPFEDQDLLNAIREALNRDRMMRDGKPVR